MIDNGLATFLDDALIRQREQEPLSYILADYPAEADILRPLLQTATTLETLQPVVMPTAGQLNADREIFLAHVANLPLAAVSPSPLIRLKGWMAEKLPRTTLISRHKERGKMIPLMFKVALILSLMFGAVGGTAALSAGTQPGSPLYPIKISIEESRLALANNAQIKAVLHLAFAQNRADEMRQMAQSGQVPNPATQAKLQLHWQQALRWMSQAPEKDMEALLAKAQVMAQKQALGLNKIQTVTAGGSPSAFMTEVEAFLTAAQENPQAFRQQHGVMRGWDDPNGPFGPRDGKGPGGGYGPGDGDGDGPGPGPGGGYGPGPGDCNGDCDGDGPGPGPGGGYGPGPGDCNGDCDGDGPGPGDGDSPGPGPGGGYGPGPGDCNGDCDGDGPGPGDGDGDGNGPGPGPGDGDGPGPGDGDGDGNGPGPGDGDGDGNGPGPGDGDCDGDCDGDGPGPGDGDGDGNGPGPGDGNGPSGYDNNSGAGDGNGNDDGNGGGGNGG